MADPNALARTYHRRKTKLELERALDILLDAHLESDDLRSQQLADVGFSFQIRSLADRERIIAIIEAAITLHDGTFAQGPAGGHFMDFSRRRIE
jgi:hypothetical protein